MTAIMDALRSSSAGCLSPQCIASQLRQADPSGVAPNMRTLAPKRPVGWSGAFGRPHPPLRSTVTGAAVVISGQARRRQDVSEASPAALGCSRALMDGESGNIGKRCDALTGMRLHLNPQTNRKPFRNYAFKAWRLKGHRGVFLHALDIN